MNEFYEILKYTIPAFIVFLTAYVLIKNTLKNEEMRSNREFALANQKTTLPIRLQAYERVVLLLERITPESLVMRVNKPGMTAKDLQQEIMSSIRAEFDHNLSQQVYISPEAWEQVKNARSAVINLISTAVEQVKPDASALILSKKIMEVTMDYNIPPTTQALEFVKKEVKKLY